MKSRPNPLLAIALLTLAGCSPATQREAEKAARELRDVGESLRRIGEEWSETMAAHTGEWTQVWQQFQSTVGGMTNAAPIPYRDLKTLLPERLGDWTAGTPSGGHEKAFGLGVSRAEVSLHRDDGATAMIRIHDAGAMQTFTTIAERASRLVQFERESDISYERAFTWKGHRGVERYHRENRDGSKRVWVGGVFELFVEARGVDESDLDELLGAIDLDRLFTLKAEANTGPPAS